MHLVRLAVPQQRPTPHLLEPLEDRTLLSIAHPLVATDVHLRTWSPMVTAAASTLSPAATTTSATPTAIITLPLTIHPIVGIPFSGDVGLITGLDPTVLPRLSGFITWGDPSPTAIPPTSPATFSFDANGTLHVAGAHTYLAPGAFPITITVLLNPPPGSLAPTAIYRIDSKALVTRNSPGGLTVFFPLNQPRTALLGTFSYSSPLANPVAPILAATINWGDGSTSNGTIIQAAAAASTLPFPTPFPIPTDLYGVVGTHTYTAIGTYRIIITITAQFPTLPAQLVATIDSTALVFPAPIARIP